MKSIEYGMVIAVGMLGALLSVPPMYAQTERSIEYQLALLGSDQPSQAVASANSISRFRTVLDELSLNYRQSREEMGYATIAMWKKLTLTPPDLKEVIVIAIQVNPVVLGQHHNCRFYSNFQQVCDIL